MNRSIATAQFGNISNATERYKVNSTIIIKRAYNVLIWKANNYIQCMQAVTTTQISVSHAGSLELECFLQRPSKIAVKMLKYGDFFAEFQTMIS